MRVIGWFSFRANIGLSATATARRRRSGGRASLASSPSCCPAGRWGPGTGCHWRQAHPLARPVGGDFPSEKSGNRIGCCLKMSLWPILPSRMLMDAVLRAAPPPSALASLCPSVLPPVTLMMDARPLPPSPGHSSTTAVARCARQWAAWRASSKCGSCRRPTASSRSSSMRRLNGLSSQYRSTSSRSILTSGL